MSRTSPYQGLRLSVFQVAPLFAGSAHGGAQAILTEMLRHFSSLGVQVTVHCTWRRDNPDEFELFPGVRVRPVLRFKETYPEPYWTSPYHLADIIDTLRRAAEDHDVFYVHDSQLHFKFAGAQRPTVAAVHDLVYGDSMSGALEFTRDRLIAVSDYLGACLHELFRRFRPLDDDSLFVVNNGFAERFAPTDPAGMRARLGLPEDAVAILYPHRPDPDKGLYDALLAVQQLKSRLPADTYARVRLLVPIWQDTHLVENSTQIQQTLYPEAQQYADGLGVADKLHLHPWVPMADMAAYYAVGAATLCVGTFPEAFGNVHVESMLSGTPAVLARVAAQRTTVPEELTRKVDPKDTEAVADHLAEIIGKGERTGPELRALLRDRFGLAQMLRGYERALLECERGPERPLGPLAGPITDETRLAVPPWAAPLRAGYYHDYTGYHRDDEGFVRCVPELSAGTTVGELGRRSGVGHADVARWLRDGLVVSDPLVAAHR
ncbi:glycosyltransferase family 4 protein [Micromonospora rosaria]|uniref:glycosyltransferase family 4 protein n=1 Tax=Micromonospora rosaria TaxID=47874 RepID=UPI00082DAD2E|nr:glycosyltransferase family 4 protein [Micromonospora rosaria]